MVDPGNPSEFSPAELDRLEDALEHCTGDPELDGDLDETLAPALRARLGEYRDLLALSREALPLEDVPDDLLAGVLAEAHASSATAPLPSPRAPAGPGLWERLRRSLLLPGVALAGSTVLLLWLVQPRDEALELLAERAPSPAPAPARLTPGDGPAPAGPEPAALAPAPQDSPEGAPRAEAELAAPAAAAVPSPVEERKEQAPPRLDSKPASKVGRHKADDAAIELFPGLDDAPTQDADKETLRDTLEQADGLRRDGRCDAAMALYQQAFTMNGPAIEEARARAGYGLCLAMQGDDGKAARYLEWATKRAPAIDAYIQRERGEGAYSKKARTKPSPAKSKLPSPEPLK